MTAVIEMARMRLTNVNILVVCRNINCQLGYVAKGELHVVGK